MVELTRILRAIARRDKAEASIKRLQDTREQNRKRLEEIMKSLDPEIELKEPYVNQATVDEIMRLRQALVRPSNPEADLEGCEQMNLLGANQHLDANIALAWQVPGMLKQVKILDDKISGLQESLGKPFDARDQNQVDEMLKLRGEERRLSILRWELIKQISSMLGFDDPHNPLQLNSELKEKGPEKVRLEIVELLKPYGSKARAKTEGDEVG